MLVLQPLNPVDDSLAVLVVGGRRIFHFEKSFAGQFGACSAVGVAAFVNSTMVQRACLVWHHLQCPEGFAFYGTAAVAFVPKGRAFIANQSAG